MVVGGSFLYFLSRNRETWYNNLHLGIKRYILLGSNATLKSFSAFVKVVFCRNYIFCKIKVTINAILNIKKYTTMNVLEIDKIFVSSLISMP